MHVLSFPRGWIRVRSENAANESQSEVWTDLRQSDPHSRAHWTFQGAWAEAANGFSGISRSNRSPRGAEHSGENVLAGELRHLPRTRWRRELADGTRLQDSSV